MPQCSIRNTHLSSM